MMENTNFNTDKRPKWLILSLMIFAAICTFRVISFVVEMCFQRISHIPTFTVQYICSYKPIILPAIAVSTAVIISKLLTDKLKSCKKRTNYFSLPILIILALNPLHFSIVTEPVFAPGFMGEINEEELSKPVSVEIRLEQPDNPDAIQFSLKDEKEMVLLSDQIIIEEKNIQTAWAELSQKYYGITLKLDEEGTKKIWELTSNNLGKRLGIIIDGELVAIPEIIEPIRGNPIVINGRFSEEKAIHLAARINTKTEPTDE